MDPVHEVGSLLEEHGVRPVLVDIGASGGAPDIWRPIARNSIYVGFDPDLREIRRDTTGGYRSGLIINKAVSPDPTTDSVTFYLTQSPYCSSMLPPDAASLRDYSFWQLFEVTSTATVPATTLTKTMQEHGLTQIDWLKVDAQGADLRIYESVHDSVRSRILAVDTEPGLLDAYCGEDLFVDVHRRLRSEGFWLSNLNIMGVPRISRAAMEALGVRTRNGLPVLGVGHLRNSPGWCEARYLRTTEWLKDKGCEEREFILAWAFAVIDGQYGHALDIARMVGDTLGNRTIGQRLWIGANEILRSASVVALHGRPNPLARLRRGLGRLRNLLAHAKLFG